MKVLNDAIDKELLSQEDLRDLLSAEEQLAAADRAFDNGSGESQPKKSKKDQQTKRGDSRAETERGRVRPTSSASLFGASPRAHTSRPSSSASSAASPGLRPEVRNGSGSSRKASARATPENGEDKEGDLGRIVVPAPPLSERPPSASSRTVSRPGSRGSADRKSAPPSRASSASERRRERQRRAAEEEALKEREREERERREEEEEDGERGGGRKEDIFPKEDPWDPAGEGTSRFADVLKLDEDEEGEEGDYETEEDDEYY